MLCNEAAAGAPVRGNSRGRSSMAQADRTLLLPTSTVPRLCPTAQQGTTAQGHGVLLCRGMLLPQRGKLRHPAVAPEHSNPSGSLLQAQPSPPKPTQGEKCVNLPFSDFALRGTLCQPPPSKN